MSSERHNTLEPNSFEPHADPRPPCEKPSCWEPAAPRILLADGERRTAILCEDHAEAFYGGVKLR